MQWLLGGTKIMTRNVEYTYSCGIEYKDIYGYNLTCQPHFIPEKWLLSLSMYWKRSALQWALPVRLGQWERCSNAKLASSQMVPSKCTYEVSCIGIEVQEWNCSCTVSILEVYTIFTHSLRSSYKYGTPHHCSYSFIIQQLFLWTKFICPASPALLYILDLFTHIYPRIGRHLNLLL